MSWQVCPFPRPPHEHPRFLELFGLLWFDFHQNTLWDANQLCNAALPTAMGQMRSGSASGIIEC
eukprot:6489412-Amphidinium_carterae.2